MPPGRADPGHLLLAPAVVALLDLGAVTMSQLRDRRAGLELQLRMADGGGATIRATPQTSLRGTPVDDLSRLLPGVLV
jgi:hypothetical protein